MSGLQIGEVGKAGTVREESVRQGFVYIESIVWFNYQHVVKQVDS